MAMSITTATSSPVVSCETAGTPGMRPIYLDLQPVHGRGARGHQGAAAHPPAGSRPSGSAHPSRPRTNHPARAMARQALFRHPAAAPHDQLPDRRQQVQRSRHPLSAAVRHSYAAASLIVPMPENLPEPPGAGSPGRAGSRSRSPAPASLPISTIYHNSRPGRPSRLTPGHSPCSGSANRRARRTRPTFRYFWPGRLAGMSSRDFGSSLLSSIPPEPGSGCGS